MSTGKAGVRGRGARIGFTAAAVLTLGAVASLLLVRGIGDVDQGDDVVSVRTEGEHLGSTDLRAIGHFDGDRTLDEAFFRRTQAGNHELVASLSSKTPMVVLAELHALDNMGVKALGPGSYATVCGKGYGGFDCEGKDEVIHLERGGVLLFQYESSSSLFYWKAGTFVTAQLSG